MIAKTPEIRFLSERKDCIMIRYELYYHALKAAAEKGPMFGQALRGFSGRVFSCESALARPGHPFGEVPRVLRLIGTDLLAQAGKTDACFLALSSICETYRQTEASLAGLAFEPPAASSQTAGPASSFSDSRPEAMAGNTPKTLPPQKAQIRPDIQEKHASPDTDTQGTDTPGTNAPDVQAPDPERIGSAIEEQTGRRPCSAPVFSAMGPSERAGYLSSVAAALYSQFPTLSAGGTSHVEFPLGRGVTAYSSVSVSGKRDGSDNVRISQALDTNTGVLKESITISDDGSSVSFKKNGVSTSVKTDSGTWKIDPTSLSRTANAKISENTSVSFTEKVDAKGFTSMEESVTTTVDHISVSTAAGIKTSASGDSSPGASPVPVPGIQETQRLRSRIQVYERLLAAGLAGELSGIPVPVLQPAF